MPRRTPEQAAQTRRDLLDAGRRLFREKGFDNVSGEELAAAAGVTRGALHHHFDDGKRGVYEAVYVEVLEELDAAVSQAGLAAARATGQMWAALVAGIESYLDLCLEPDVAEISLRQGPAVLGWTRWDELDRQFSVKQLSGTLELLMAAGDIETQPVLPLAEILVGALNQVGRIIACSDDGRATREAMGASLNRLLHSLRVES